MTKAERERARYATNAASRAKQRERQNRWWRDRYANDPEFRERYLAQARERSFLRKGWGFRSTTIGG